MRKNNKERKAVITGTKNHRTNNLGQIGMICVCFEVRDHPKRVLKHRTPLGRKNTPVMFHRVAAQLLKAHGPQGKDTGSQALDLTHFQGPPTPAHL